MSSRELEQYKTRTLQSQNCKLWWQWSGWWCSERRVCCRPGPWQSRPRQTPFCSFYRKNWGVPDCSRYGKLDPWHTVYSSDYQKAFRFFFSSSCYIFCVLLFWQSSLAPCNQWWTTAHVTRSLFVWHPSHCQQAPPVCVCLECMCQYGNGDET